MSSSRASLQKKVWFGYTGCEALGSLPFASEHTSSMPFSWSGWSTYYRWAVARRTRWARLAALPGVTVLTESGSLSPGGNRASHHDFGASPARYVTVLWPTQCQWHCSMPVSTAQIMMQRVPPMTMPCPDPPPPGAVALGA